jgi:hypothetical protein
MIMDEEHKRNLPVPYFSQREVNYIWERYDPATNLPTGLKRRRTGARHVFQDNFLSKYRRLTSHKQRRKQQQGLSWEAKPCYNEGHNWAGERAYNDEGLLPKGVAIDRMDWPCSSAMAVFLRSGIINKQRNAF